MKQKDYMKAANEAERGIKAYLTTEQRHIKDIKIGDYVKSGSDIYQVERISQTKNTIILSYFDKDIYKKEIDNTYKKEAILTVVVKAPFIK